MTPAAGVALWRNLTFANGALALLAVAAALLLTVPLGDRGPAPRPQIAVLVDAARQADWLALANPAGTRLELRALHALAPPPDSVFALWLIAGPGEPPRALSRFDVSRLDASRMTTGWAIEQLPVLLRPGATLAISIEPAGGGRATPSGPLVDSGTVVATDALPAIPIAQGPAVSGSP
jgi:anti-sigma-K factor RskA